MAFPRQKNLNEVADHAQLDELARIALLVHGQVGIGRFGRLAAGNKVLVPDAPGHLGKRKSVQAPAHVAALVTIGKAAHKDRIECRARHNTQLAKLGDGLGKAPIRHTNAHSALNNSWELEHFCIVSQKLWHLR